MDARRRALLVLAALAAMGCPPGPGLIDRVSTQIGPEGGTLTHGSGAQLRIPPGALTATVEVSIESGAAPGGSGLHGTALGPTVVLGPEGQRFERPVEVVLPYDPARLPASAAPDSARVATKPKDASDFVQLDSTVDLGARTVTAQTMHFSQVVPMAPAVPLDITTGGALPRAVWGVEFAPVFFAASGGTPPHAWSVSAGALPVGLGVDFGANGVARLSGQPTATGTSFFVMRVTDGQGQSVEKLFVIEVLADGSPWPALLYSTSPAAVVAGAPDTVVNLTGENLAPGCIGYVGPAQVAATCSSATAAQLTVPAALLASAGGLDITLFNAPPGGPTNSVLLTVLAPSSLAVTDVAPPSAPVRGASASLTVTGSGFVAGSAVTLDGASVPTTGSSATSLTATVPTTVLSQLGFHALTVSNVLAGGGVSNLARFTVTDPVPTLTGTSPAALPAGYAATTLTLYGTDFTDGAMAYLGAKRLPTQVVSTTLATVALAANDLVNPGTFNLRLVNPPPVGGASKAFVFSVVTLPAPTVLATTPNAVGVDLATDATTVFWTERTNASPAVSAVKAVQIVGGGVTTLAADGQAALPRGLSLGRCDVYWVNSGNAISQTPGAVMGAPLFGTGPGRASSSSGELNLVRYDALTDQLFWTTGPDVADTLYSAPATGGPALRLNSGSWIKAFALDADGLYFVSRGTGASSFINGAVMRMDRSGMNLGTLASNQDDPRGIAVSGGRVYWATGKGQLNSVNTTGTPAVATLVAGESGVSSLAVEGTDLFWTTATEVRSEPVAGGPVTIWATGLPGPHALAVDASNLYWLSGDGKVLKLARPGGPPVPSVNPCAGNPGWAYPQAIASLGAVSVAVDAANAYFTDGASSAQGRVYKVPLAGGSAPALIASGQQLPRKLRVANGTLYWANYGSSNGSIMAWSLSGAGVPWVVSTSQTVNVEDLAIDSSGLWWVSSVNDTVVHNGTAVATGQGVPLSVGLDATYVYWIKGQDGSVWKQLKAGGSPVLVATNPIAGSLAVGGGYGYWVGGTGSSIIQQDLTTGTQVTLATGQTSPRNLAVDGADLYWVTEGTFPNYGDGKVKRLTGGVGTPVVIADGQPAPGDITFDAQYVYWVTGGTTGVQGAVFKLPKNARP